MTKRHIHSNEAAAAEKMKKKYAIYSGEQVASAAAAAMCGWIEFNSTSMSCSLFDSNILFSLSYINCNVIFFCKSARDARVNIDHQQASKLFFVVFKSKATAVQQRWTLWTICVQAQGERELWKVWNSLLQTS